LSVNTGLCPRAPQAELTHSAAADFGVGAISEDCNPTIGIMREGSDGSSKFVFDLMAPERPKVDRLVLDLVRSTVFELADFTMRGEGLCRPDVAAVSMLASSYAMD
jgi:hypothetical protein